MCDVWQGRKYVDVRFAMECVQSVCRLCFLALAHGGEVLPIVWTYHCDHYVALYRFASSQVLCVLQVWDEKTSARLDNEARALSTCVEPCVCLPA